MTVDEDDRYSDLLDMKLAKPGLGVEDRQSSLSLAACDKDGDADRDDSSNESDNSLAAAPREVSTVAVEETRLCRTEDLAVGL